MARKSVQATNSSLCFPTPPSPIKSSPGRRRSEVSHQAILKAAAELLDEEGYVGMSIEAIARRAGVGKQTIYRWWPSKAAVVLESYYNQVDQALSLPNTGSVAQDLTQVVRQLLQRLTSSAAAKAMAGILAEAQADPNLAQAFRDKLIASRRAIIQAILRQGIARGELRDDLDIELTTDLIYGPVWYRLLLGHAPLDEAFACSLVDELLIGLQSFEED